MVDPISILFSSDSFIPHGHCYLWLPQLVWLHVLSDTLICLAYYSIPLTLFEFVRKREDLPFNWIFLLFATFITACGTTHLLSVWTLWHPTYWLSGAAKALTALVSVGTAIALIRLIPKALAIPSQAQLERANNELKKEIEQRHRTQTQLELQAIITRTIAEGVCLVRECDRVIVYANPKFEQLFGYDPGELNGKPISLVNYSDAQIQPETQANQIFERISEAGEWTYQVHNVKKDGTPFWCEATASTFEHPEYGRVLVAVQQDITARKEAEEQLQSLSNRLSLALESGAIGTWEWDILKDVHYWDDRMCALYGIQECTLQEQAWFESLHPDDRASIEAALQDALAGKADFNAEFRICRQDGHLRFLKAAALVQRNAQGKPYRMVGTTYDITDLKQTQESLQASLKEKEVLLQEIHHRVKNNLQIVYSLLRLQRRKLTDRQASLCLLESQNRIESIGLIHEKLYRSGNLAKINFAEYIPSLITNLFSSYDASSDQIGFKTEIELISLDIDRAIPCGLIINELVSNSLKYAFPNGCSGEIYVKLYTDSEPDQIVLVVGDDGIGIPTGTDFSQLKTLGLQLVHDLAAQLKGTIYSVMTVGTEFQIMFPRGAC